MPDNYLTVSDLAEVVLIACALSFATFGFAHFLGLIEMAWRNRDMLREAWRHWSRTDA